MGFSEKQMREGRARLAAMQGEAREEARKTLRDPAFEVKNATVLGQSVFPRLKEENLDSLILHRGVKGWYADMVLKDMPAGLASVFGTPTKHPLPTRAAAEADAKLMLVTVFRAILEREQTSRDAAPKDVRPFELHGATYSLPGELVEQIKPILESMPVEISGTPDSVSERLLEQVRPFVDDKGDLDIEAVNRLPSKDQMAMLANMATLLCMGVFRLPGRTPDPIPEDDDIPRMN